MPPCGGAPKRSASSRNPKRASASSASIPSAAKTACWVSASWIRIEPPHGGIAYGVDRIVQRLCGAETIRDVIAFPKTASGFDLLTGAPAPVETAQLRELGVSLHERKLPGH